MLNRLRKILRGGILLAGWGRCREEKLYLLREIETMNENKENYGSLDE